MLKIKNTVPCPGCGSLLRVSARIVSDGSEFEYYLCSKCVDIAKKDPATGEWKLEGAKAPEIPEVVRTLQGLAVQDWKGRTAKRESVISTRIRSELPEKARPTARTVVFEEGLGAELPEKDRPTTRTVVFEPS